MFYSKSTGGFYDTAIHGENMPADAVNITKEEHAALMVGQSSGKIITADANGRPFLMDAPDPAVSVSERAWRDSELIRSDIELYKVQDSDPKAVGTVAGWREYRKALRDWPENKDFPNKDKRPASPDA